MSRKKKFRIREKRQRIPRLDIPEPAVRNERKQRVFVPKMVSPKTDNQARLIEAINQNDITIALGPAGTGKAQPLSSTVWTPTGPIKMKDVQVGQIVCTPDGGTAKVLAVYPQGKKQIYRIWFNNDTYVDCCRDHLWKIDKPGHWKSARVVDTNYILSHYRGNNGRRLLYISLPAPCKFDAREIPIDPYILGYLLGNGGLTVASWFSTIDEEVFQRFTESLKDNRFEQQDKCTWRIVGKELKKNDLLKSLKELGIIGHKSVDKFIPDSYLYNTVEVRKQLLQGLMDSDGFPSGAGAEFSTSSTVMSKQFQTLVGSLGGICRVVERLPKFRYKGKLKTGHKSYRCYPRFNDPFMMFWLPRKKDRLVARTKYFPKKIIDRVERLGRKECQCILIDHPDHLYLTDDFTPTHNTHLSVGVAISMFRTNLVDHILISRPLVGAGEDSGALPGTDKQKILPYLRPLFDELAQFASQSELSEWQNVKELEIVPIQFMRGRTFKNSVIVVDEAQNATYEQLKMIISRLGEGSRMVIVADPEQSDLPPRAAGGINEMVKRLTTPNEEDGCSIVRLGEQDIVRHPILRKIMKRL